MISDDNGSTGQAGTQPACGVCRIIRVYLMIGAPLLLMMMIKPELGMLRGLPLTTIFAVAISIGFVGLVAWKAYTEYWRH